MCDGSCVLSTATVHAPAPLSIGSISFISALVDLEIGEDFSRDQA
jgi:hypothetical protein